MMTSPSGPGSFMMKRRDAADGQGALRFRFGARRVVGMTGGNRRVRHTGNDLNGQKIMTDDTWGHARNDLLKRIGKNNFVTWIEPLRLSGIEAGVARFEVPTVFFGDWVSRNYSDQIRVRPESSG